MEQTNPLSNPTVPPQIPVNPPANQPVKTSSSSKPILIILFVVGLIALSSLGTYFIVKSQVKPQAPASSSSPVSSSSVQASPTPSVIDETANWKTYTNTKYNYSFKYPQDWILQNKQLDIENGMIDNIEFIKNGQNRLLEFSAYQNSTSFGSTAKGYLQYYQNMANENTEGPAMIVTSNNKKINNNINGFQLSIGGADVTKKIVFDDNGKLFVISPNIMAMSPKEQSENEKTVDQILSTFKFN